MRRPWLAVAIAAALAFPASAEADSIRVKTTNGKSCTVETITQPSRFGFTIAPCVARRAGGVAFLYDDDVSGPEPTMWTTGGYGGPLPFDVIGEVPAEGERVGLEFALFLKPQRHKRDRAKVKWRRKTGGKICKRSGPTILNCSLVTRTN